MLEMKTMNDKDMREDIHKNRDTNKGNIREQNSDMWRYLLSIIYHFNLWLSGLGILGNL